MAKKKLEWTPLHTAAQQGNVPEVRRLLAEGADPNAREPGDNTTPLHWAAARRNADIARMLLDAGADPRGEGDLHELDAIGWASFYHSDESTGPDDGGDVVSLLLERGAKHNIYSALSIGDPALVRQVVRDDPKALARRMSRFEDKRTPLHFAIWRKRNDLLALLVELGADVEGKNAHGRTALLEAMLMGDAEAMRILSKAGAKRPRFKKVADIAPMVAKLAKPTSHTKTMLSVRDVPAAVAWYKSLGFTEVGQFGTDFGIVALGKAELFLKAAATAPPLGREVGVWFHVKKVDEIHELLRSRQLAHAEALLEGKAASSNGVRFNEDLYDPFYGGRQFSIIDPDGYTIFFYQEKKM